MRLLLVEEGTAQASARAKFEAAAAEFIHQEVQVSLQRVKILSPRSRKIR